MSTYTASLDNPRVKRLVQYVAVGAAGIGINQGTLFVATAFVGIPYAVSGALGRVLSVLFNYVVNDRWTWDGHGADGTRQWIVRGGKYVATRVVGMAIGLTTLVALVEFGGLHYLLANLVAIGIGVAWGFLASELWVWGDEGDGRAALAGARERVRWIRRNVKMTTCFVLALSAGLFVALSLYTTALYHSFWSTGADLGAYAHAFATTLDGTGFLQQGKYRINHPGGSYWGAHFSLTVLVFLVPFAIHPSPVTLLVVKSLVIAAAVPLCWLVARDHVDSERVAGLLTVSYALNPFLWTAAIYDFQEQILLPILLFGAYYAYRRGRHGWFLGLLALALLTNEFVVFVVAGFLGGLAIAAARQGRLRETGGVFAAALVLVVAVKLLSGAVMAQFSRFGGIPTDRVADPIAAAVVGGGDAPVRIPLGTILATVLTNPALALDALLIDLPIKLLFFGLLLLPVMGVALADESTLGALVPYLGLAWILADNPAYYHFGAHYSLYVLPFVYIGAARSFGRVSRWTSSRRIASATTAAIALCLVATLVGGVVVTGMGYQMIPEHDDRTETLEAAIDDVPEDATLVTQNTIYPHVATRSGATFVMDAENFRRYQQRYGAVTPEYVLIDSELDTRPKDWSRPVFRAFSDRIGDEYGLYRYQDGIFVLKRGYDGPTQAITADDYTVETRRYHPDRSSIAGVTFESSSTIDGSVDTDPSGVTWQGPWTLDDATLPPGVYVATFRVKTGGPGIGALGGTNARRTPGLETASPRTHDTVQYVGVSAEEEGVLGTASVEVTGEWTNVSVAFTLDRAGVIKFHGFTEGGHINVKWVELEEVSDG